MRQEYDEAMTDLNDAIYIAADRIRELEAEVVALRMAKIRRLEWSEAREPNENCAYTHIVADSPIGLYQVEWKSWKDYDSRKVFRDDDYVGESDTLDGAKAEAQRDFETCILEAMEDQTDE